MITKILLVTVIIFQVSFAQFELDSIQSTFQDTSQQDSNAISNATVIDTTQPIDSPTVLSKPVNSIDSISIPAIIHNCEYTEAKLERRKIAEIYSDAKKLDSISARKLKIHADSILLKWRLKYPEEANVEKSKAIIKGAGIVQVLTGVAGFIFTIVDANMEEEVSYTYSEPVFNTRGVQTGTKGVTQKMSYKHKWGMPHTILSILSTGFIISGIVTINF